jgi:hypothetical protein
VSTRDGPLYEFVYRGELAREALDKAGGLQRNLPEEFDATLAQRLGLSLLDDAMVGEARAMAVVYVAVAAFENSVRKLIRDVLLEKDGEQWWQNCVSEKIRTRAESRREEEEKVKWHAQRGESPLNYTELADLANIIRNNWPRFEPYVPSIEWASSIFSVLERSRNVIMHSGQLGRQDVERVGINIRDWISQVGV